jgi:hypothetical protein
MLPHMRTQYADSAGSLWVSGYLPSDVAVCLLHVRTWYADPVRPRLGNLRLCADITAICVRQAALYAYPVRQFSALTVSIVLSHSHLAVPSLHTRTQYANLLGA